MSEFHDPELRQQLGRISGPYPDENAAFAAWQKRVGQARRRRAMAVTTGAAMSLIIAVVAFAALQRPESRRVVENKTPQTTAVASSRPLATEPETSDSAVTVPSTEPETTVDATDPATTEPTPAITIPVDAGNGEQPPAPPTSTKKSGGGSTATTTATTKTTHTTQAPTTTQTVTQTEPAEPTMVIPSQGGSITVRWDGRRLRIIDVQEAAGFEKHELDSSNTKVGMTFTSGNHQSVITAWVYHGMINKDVKEGGPPDHQENFPPVSTTTPDGDHAG